jgi:hypothetical protein
MGDTARDATSAQPGLPDINAETYPFAAVEQMLDQAAFFNLYATGGGTPIVARSGRGTIGFALCEPLRRLSIVMSPPTVRHGLRAFNRLGECIASINQRWMFMPDGFAARPDVEPPECAFTPSEAQRFVMLDNVFWLEGGADGFRGFGTGRTEPTGREGDVTGAYAIGTIVEGFGRFRGCIGTYTCCGNLSPSGFRGSVLLRVMDPESLFRAEWLEIPAADAPLREAGVTYLFLSGHKQGSGSKTAYLYDAAGSVAGLGVEQQLRLMTVDCGVASGGEIRCSSSLGPAVGRMTARIGFNLLNPGAPGSADAPIPFKSYNHYVLTAPDGTDIGAFDADGNEGRTFTMTLPGAPGQRALRFGGFGPILNGVQRFAGISGQMTDNSVVGLFPHAIATSYVLRVFDASGMYRTDGLSSR